MKKIELYKLIGWYILVYEIKWSEVWHIDTVHPQCALVSASYRCWLGASPSGVLEPDDRAPFSFVGMVGMGITFGVQRSAFSVRDYGRHQHHFAPTRNGSTERYLLLSLLQYHTHNIIICIFNIMYNAIYVCI